MPPTSNHHHSSDEDSGLHWVSPMSLIASGKGKRDFFLPIQAGVWGRRGPMSTDPARASKDIRLSLLKAKF